MKKQNYELSKKFMIRKQFVFRSWTKSL